MGSEPRGPRAAGRAARDEQGRRRTRHPLRPRGRCEDRAALRLRAQELLLPRPAEGLPDQPVRRTRRAGRQPHVRVREGRQAGDEDRQPDPRPPRGRRRQVAARGLPRHERHRPEPRRHAAAGDRLRAGNPQRRGSRRLREGAARPRDVAGRLRRQHAGRFVPLRRQRVRAPRRPEGIRHALRDQEPELVPLHGRSDPLRSAAPDRADRGRRPGRAGHAPVGPGPQGNAPDAQQGRRAGLPLLPGPRPAAARHCAGLDRPREGRHAGTAGRHARALHRRLRPARVRRADPDVVAGDGDVFRSRRRQGRQGKRQGGRELADGRRVVAPEPRRRHHRELAGRSDATGAAHQAHRRRHHQQQGRQGSIGRDVGSEVGRRAPGRPDHRREGPEADVRHGRAGSHRRRSPRQQRQVGRAVQGRQGSGHQRADRPVHEGVEGQGESGAGHRAAEEEAGGLTPAIA
ncbi:hypothetical protein Lal_00015007 [Lupinus albus]|nr:hypothetical protein Lal_00015007 [Lupinus albus]